MNNLDSEMDVEDKKDSLVDHQFHNKFWSFMQFLNDPQTVLKTDESWNKMLDCLAAVLAVFASNSKDVSGTRDLKSESMSPFFRRLTLKKIIFRNSSLPRNYCN